LSFTTNLPLKLKINRIFFKINFIQSNSFKINFAKCYLNHRPRKTKSCSSRKKKKKKKKKI